MVSSKNTNPVGKKLSNVSKKYDHISIEETWKSFWEDQKLFQDSLGGDRGMGYGVWGSKEDERSVGFSNTGSSRGISPEKLMLLFAFAYPSGSGLHVGHVESKTALDILARTQRMQGKNVYFPVGWDAFGLPAENYAIKTGVHPAETTVNAIHTFRRQIKRIGISYDWANEIATSHPGYYKWTQWIFLQLFKKGLAYQKDGLVNWCPSCQTVLANEQVVEGLCERCDSEVEQKQLKQWYFKITDYKDELISGLDDVDWPQPTKQQQLNWIGKKEGINIEYGVSSMEYGDSGETITCFTTRPDTNFGATFVVLAPEHEFVQKIISGKLAPADKSIPNLIRNYYDKSQKKTELERQQEGRNKSGVFTGFYAHNNLTGKKMPIWVSDFVLGGFGTGAVVGVPGHDKRDFEFTQYVNKNYPEMPLEVIRVVTTEDGDSSPITSLDQVQEEEGKMVNSGFLDGLDIREATSQIMNHLEEKGWGKRVTTYKLRDWLISRQRYWGAPIPVVYDPEGNSHPVKEEHLPWVLPTDVDFKPTGESPLKSSKEFIERTEKLYGKGWRPEFDTMDTFVDSSWYYLRYCDSRNEDVFADKKRLAEWLPVDMYLIGPEHIVLHLLYSRFFTKFLRDEGYLNFSEPFSKMRHQGMILGPDGKKMSKSKGNVINPDEIIKKFGADTLRVYEMFMGPLEADKPWSTTAVSGVYRFLSRVYRLAMLAVQSMENGVFSDDTTSHNSGLSKKLHQTIKKVSEDIPSLKFNTAIAMMMEFVNEWSVVGNEYGVLSMEDGVMGMESVRGGVKGVISREELESFIKILAPFAPFLAEELWQKLHNADSTKPETSIHLQKWPDYDPKMIVADEVTIAVQVNGKLRGEFQVESSVIEDKQAILDQAKQVDTVQKWIEGQIIKKEIYVAGKIVSLVI